MHYINVKFPQRKEYYGTNRERILGLLNNNRFGVAITLKPKFKQKHWWDIGIVVETELLDLIRYNYKTIHVYSDKHFKKYICKLCRNNRGYFSHYNIPKNIYKGYDLNKKDDLIKVYRLILGVPYHYFIIKN